jgi:hypothetical protein
LHDQPPFSKQKTREVKQQKKIKKDDKRGIRTPEPEGLAPEASAFDRFAILPNTVDNVGIAGL